MPILVNVVDGGTGIEVYGYDHLSKEQLLTSKQEVYAGDNTIKQRYQLIDFTEVTSSDANLESIRELTAYDIEASRMNPNISIALVGQQDIVFGLGRMWQALLESTPFQVKICRSRKEAEEWIDKQLNII